MNKITIVTAAAACMLSLAGCGKAKLEAPACPDQAKGGQAINEPGLSPVVSDNGQFTYLKFGVGQSVPNFTALKLDGSERIIQSSFNPETRVATIFGIYPAIVLRDGKRVACIRNMNYDPRSPQARITNVRDDGAIW